MRLKDLSLIINNIASQLIESRFARNTQQNILEQLLTQLRNLQEHQLCTNSTLQSFTNDRSRIRGLRHSANKDEVNAPYTLQHSMCFSSSLPQPFDTSSGTISMRVQQGNRFLCPGECSCRCHTHREWRTSQLLDQIIGRLFIGYSRTPSLMPNCDKSSCSKYQHHITVTYVFPAWFLPWILFMNLLHTKRDGPVFNLRTIMRRPNTDPVFHIVRSGNIAKLRSLFQKGDVSPFDINNQDDNLLYVRMILSPNLNAS